MPRSTGAHATRFRRMPAIFVCCRRARPRRCGNCPNATASSRGWRAGSVFARSESITAGRAARMARRSWSLRSLIGLSIEGLTSFSVAPLRLASLLGLLMAAGALVFGVVILAETFIYGKSVPGYPSLVVGLMVLGGVQLLMIGIVGEYIGKILSELKARPVYFVAEHSVRTADGRATRRGRRRSECDRRIRRPAHLAVRRRLRHFDRGQHRDPRSCRGRTDQRDVGDGGGAWLPPFRCGSRSPFSTPGSNASPSGCISRSPPLSARRA